MYNVVNKFVRNKILKENLLIICVGLLTTFVTIWINWVIAKINVAVLFFYLITLIGIFAIFFGLFRLIYWPANPVYKSWKFYGSSDPVINNIKRIINNKKKDLETKELIISEGWLIKPEDFIFVKSKDINWIYFTYQTNKNSNFSKQKINIYTRFGLNYEVDCLPIKLNGKAEDVTPKDIKTYYNVLHRLCKNAIWEYSPEYKLFWKKSPESFVEKVKSYIAETKTAK